MFKKRSIPISRPNGTPVIFDPFLTVVNFDIGNFHFAAGLDYRNRQLNRSLCCQYAATITITLLLIILMIFQYQLIIASNYCTGIQYKAGNVIRLRYPIWFQVLT